MIKSFRLTPELEGRLEKAAAAMSPSELGEPWKDWPRRLEDNVWLLGNPSTRNIGAMAYFIARPGGGVKTGSASAIR